MGAGVVRSRVFFYPESQGCDAVRLEGRGELGVLRSGEEREEEREGGRGAKMG